MELQIWFYSDSLSTTCLRLPAQLSSTPRIKLGRDLDILLAWVALSLITLLTIQYLVRRGEVTSRGHTNACKDLVREREEAPLPRLTKRWRDIESADKLMALLLGW